MVRGSKLPMRLMALRHGADLVYTDELIDFSLLMSERRVNGKFNQKVRKSLAEIDHLLFPIQQTS